MGYYIDFNSKGDFLPRLGKADVIIKDGGREIPVPSSFQENLVCVIENLQFDAALYCYCQSEFEYVRDLQDGRYKRWIIYDHAKELAD